MQDQSERHFNRLARRVDNAIEREKEQTDRRAAHAFSERIRDKEQKQGIAREKAKEDRAYSIYSAAESEFDRDPITEVPDEVRLPSDYFEEVAHKVEYNKTYADHYMQRFEDTNLEKYRHAAERIESCHKSWFGDRYKEAGVFNVKRVFHCHNRWCWLCTHLKQAQRLCKFENMFETLLKDYDLYHIVFTVKNVTGDVLENTLERMQDASYKIIRYFQGRGKITGLDFMQYGFSGAVRSFEIVISPREYHPHLHLLFTLKKDLEFSGRNINKFSFDKKNPGRKRVFTDFEIMLQKMFYLAVNKQRITLNSMQELKLGYSCTADHVEGKQWHEVFKYATKMSKDGASSATYEQFVLLDDIFHRMKFIQGYGIFKGIDNKRDERDPTAEILFEKVLIMLNRREKPERDIHIELDKLVEELHHDNVKVISKNMAYKYLQAIVEDLKADFKLTVEDGFEPF